MELVNLVKVCNYKNCNKKHVNKKCGKCQKVWYCCRKCQKKDWNSVHRDICR